MSSAFGWKPAWDSIEDDDPHFAGKNVYQLPTQYEMQIYEGDRFWVTDEHFLIEIEEVKTKIYRGVVGPTGEEGNDAVFFTPDWKPPRDPHTDSHYTDDIHHMDVEKFATRIDESDLSPHRGNGLPPRPPY